MESSQKSNSLDEIPPDPLDFAGLKRWIWAVISSQECFVLNY